ncbi:MAG TPA: MgtC/SapB family protein [Macromonas sp.]|nr:MgtC/SapB family protein [Macromonas sp.]
MNPFYTLLASYWSPAIVEVNLLIFANLLGALLLGLIVGYERAYHGRAAGMRTYGIVCMASAALTVFTGYPHFWWGGHGVASAMPGLDPTRVVQGIVTGIGFLGAGVIMKEGLNINGLTTAASIWASSAIGVLVGVGFYPAAILLTLLSATLMMWGAKMESRLPSRRAVGVTLKFQNGQCPPELEVRDMMQSWGYGIADGSMHIVSQDAQVSWQFVMVAMRSQPLASSLFELARLLRSLPGVNGVDVMHARN